MNKIKEYGVWDMSIRNWEEAGLDYNNAIGLALFCCENDDIGPRNFAVVECTLNDEGVYIPIWHMMAWHGGFHGYDWLLQHCIAMGEVTERGIDVSTTI